MVLVNRQLEGVSTDPQLLGVGSGVLSRFTGVVLLGEAPLGAGGGGDLEGLCVRANCVRLAASPPPLPLLAAALFPSLRGDSRGRLVLCIGGRGLSYADWGVLLPPLPM